MPKQSQLDRSQANDHTGCVCLHHKSEALEWRDEWDQPATRSDYVVTQTLDQQISQPSSTQKR